MLSNEMNSFFGLFVFNNCQRQKKERKKRYFIRQKKAYVKQDLLINKLLLNRQTYIHHISLS